jgi:FkbM family methyltransferase
MTTINVKNIIKRILNYSGFELKRLQKSPKLHANAFIDQKDLLADCKVKTIFDVGANIGETIKEYQTYFKTSKFYCFEPFPDAFSVLYDKYKNDSSIKLFKAAVTDQTGIKRFYYNKASYTSSLLRVSAESNKFVDSRLTESLGHVDVESVVLDDLCKNEAIKKINILKMDIQGGELMALEGADRLLRRKSIDLIYTEVLFAHLYEKQANFTEVYDYLRKHDYTLYGLYNLAHGENGFLAWGDAIFISPIIEKRVCHNLLATKK